MHNSTAYLLIKQRWHIDSLTLWNEVYYDAIKTDAGHWKQTGIMFLFVLYPDIASTYRWGLPRFGHKTYQCTRTRAGSATQACYLVIHR